MTPEEALAILDETPDEGQVPVGEQPPVEPAITSTADTKQARKAAVVTPYLEENAQSQRMADPHTMAHKDWASSGERRLKQEWEGLKQGASDPLVGTDQALRHAFGTPEEAQAADQAVNLREAEYQKKSGKGGGLGRFAGNVGMAAPAFLLGEVGATGAAGVGLVDALMQPISGEAKGDYAKAKAGQAAAGVALSQVPGASIAVRKAMARGGLLPESVTGQWPLSKLNMKPSEQYAQEAQQGYQSLRKAGIEKPTVGQVSSGGLTAHDTPPPKIAKTQYQQMQGKFEKTLDQLHPLERTPEAAGEVYRKGLEGVVDREGNVLHEGWMQRSQQAVDKQYEKMYKSFPSTSPVDMTPVVKRLTAMTTPNPKAPAQSSAGIPRVFNESLDLLLQDLQDVGLKKGKALDFETVKELRSELGKKIKDFESPGSKLPSAAVDLRKLYGAYTQAMRDAARAKGPRALKAFDEANSAHELRMETYDNFVKPILSKDTPEDVFLAAMKDEKRGPTRIATALDLVNKSEADVMRATFLQRLADEGGELDLQKFSKNWLSLPEKNRVAVTLRSGSGLRNTLDKIAEHAKNINPEKVQSIWAQRNEYAARGALGEWYKTALLTGAHKTADILMSVLTMGHFSGKTLTNPALMKWINSTSTKSGAKAVTAISSLRAENRKLPPEQQQEVQEFLSALGAEENPELDQPGVVK